MDPSKVRPAEPAKDSDEAQGATGHAPAHRHPAASAAGAAVGAVAGAVAGALAGPAGIAAGAVAGGVLGSSAGGAAGERADDISRPDPLRDRIDLRQDPSAPQERPAGGKEPGERG